jgi:hypothetical protein
MGDLGFFGIGENDYSKNFLGEKLLLEWSDVSAYARGYRGRGQWSVGR